ncbi:MAG: hypothetical protein JKY37_14205 [Nannocystaceae bacterium]|nr:hypothetical protein [Nannocystaceae bacterium]
MRHPSVPFVTRLSQVLMPAVAIAFSLKIPAAVSMRVQQEVFWVTRPESNRAAALRTNLLLDHFGYTLDTAELFATISGFFISDARTPKKVATAEQINGWPREQGRVQVTLSDYWVGRIQTFNEEQVQRAVEQAASRIADPQLRALFIATISTVLTESGSQRTHAFMTLLNGVTASQTSKSAVAEALTALEAAGYDNNPYLALAKANLALAQHQSKQGPGYETQVNQLLQETMRRLHDAAIIPSAGAALTREDFVLVNQQLARIQTEMGDEDDANRRQWIARFYGMSEQERARYREGQLIQLVPPNTHSVRRPGAVDNQIADLDEAWDERQAMEEAIKSIGGRKPKNADRTDAFNRELDQGVTITGAKRRKRRGPTAGYRPKYIVSSVEVPLRNPGQMTRLKRGGGALNLATLFLTFVAADRRMKELAEYMNKRESLVNKVNRRKVRVVPPRPEMLRSQVRVLLAADKTTHDVRRKQEIQIALGSLRAVLEESRAAWPGQ